MSQFESYIYAEKAEKYWKHWRPCEMKFSHDNTLIYFIISETTVTTGSDHHPDSSLQMSLSGPGVSQLVDEWINQTINQSFIYKALFRWKEAAQGASHNKKSSKWTGSNKALYRPVDPVQSFFF